MQASPEFRYRLLRRIAVDPDRVLFLGEQLGVANFSRRVAIKVYQAESGAIDTLLDAIRHQVRLVSALHHSSIVSLSDSGIHEGAPFLVLDYVDGPDLGAILRRRHDNPVPLQVVLRIGARIADALHYVHTSNSHRGRDAQPVHGGLCPSRVLVEVSGAVRVIGFGSVLKDLAYSSPEQLRGDRLDGRSDLFSLGALLYESLTGVQPFRQSTEHRTVDAILGHACEPPSIHRHDLGPTLDQLILGCLEKDPANRPESAEGLRQQLRSSLGCESSWDRRAELSAFLANTFHERVPGAAPNKPTTTERPPWDKLAHRLSARVVPLPTTGTGAGLSTIGLVTSPGTGGPPVSPPPPMDEAEAIEIATGSSDA